MPPYVHGIFVLNPKKGRFDFVYFCFELCDLIQEYTCILFALHLFLHVNCEPRI